MQGQKGHTCEDTCEQLRSVDRDNRSVGVDVKKCLCVFIFSQLKRELINILVSIHNLLQD